MPSRPPTGVSPAAQYQATIIRLGRADPASPAQLNAQLAYAGFLLSGATGPSCAERVNRAQEQLGSVAASPKTQVMFPGGWALVADLEYRQHLARAACGLPAERKDELLAAVEAARRAAELYRKAFDYHSRVVMQFNSAIALHRLGDNTAALAALAAALRMDREYGFKDDARENYALLLRWSGKRAGAAQVAALMHDFPSRRAVLKFGWYPSEGRITLARRRMSLTDGHTVRTDAAAAFERRITAVQGGGWSVSYAHRLTGYEPGVWPSAADAAARQLVFPPAPLPAVDFKVSATGDFAGVTDSKAFAARLIARTDALIRARAPSGPDRGATRDAVATAAVALSPGMLEAETAEVYQLETAMWIGATLEQGVWYQISAPLALPGLSRFILQQRIEFAFTRRVRCTADAAARSCVEIVIHATPDQHALDNLLADLGSSPVTKMDYAASTDARIVVDPATLLPYTREERTYWYASLGRSGADKILQSDHLMCSTRYAVH